MWTAPRQELRVKCELSIHFSLHLDSEMQCDQLLCTPASMTSLPKMPEDPHTVSLKELLSGILSEPQEE